MLPPMSFLCRTVLFEPQQHQKNWPGIEVDDVADEVLWHAGSVAIFTLRRSNMARSNDARYNFYASPTVDELIAQQGKGPIHDLSVR
jgi:hypothetical protein